MKKLIKNVFFKVAAQYSKNRFTEVEVHQNPFGQDIKNIKLS